MAFDKLFLNHVLQHEFTCIKSLVEGLKNGEVFKRPVHSSPTMCIMMRSNASCFGLH